MSSPFNDSSQDIGEYSGLGTYPEVLRARRRLWAASGLPVLWALEAALTCWRVAVVEGRLEEIALKSP
jgi:hypothetical protein